MARKRTAYGKSPRRSYARKAAPRRAAPARAQTVRIVVQSAASPVADPFLAGPAPASRNQGRF